MLGTIKYLDNLHNDPPRYVWVVSPSVAEQTEAYRSEISSGPRAGNNSTELGTPAVWLPNVHACCLSHPAPYSSILPGDSSCGERAGKVVVPSRFPHTPPSSWLTGPLTATPPGQAPCCPTAQKPTSPLCSPFNWLLDGESPIPALGETMVHVFSHTEAGRNPPEASPSPRRVLRITSGRNIPCPAEATANAEVLFGAILPWHIFYPSKLF